jgi:hypothetical protein
MDRGQAVQADTDELDAEDARYWAHATVKEKLQTITYLRECFYGPEATTGRLQGFYRLLKQK